MQSLRPAALWHWPWACIAAVLVCSLMFVVPAHSDEILAEVIADGKAWDMYVVKRRKSNILVFRADGRGTISNGFDSIYPTWRAMPNGICIKPEVLAERCLVLSRDKGDITASQNGRAVFILKR